MALFEERQRTDRRAFELKRLEDSIAREEDELAWQVVDNWRAVDLDSETTGPGRTRQPDVVSSRVAVMDGSTRDQRHRGGPRKLADK